MSIQSDAEVAANVTVGGTDRSALFYDSTAHIWYTKNQAGTLAPLVNGVTSVTNSDGTLTISPTTGAAVASLAASYKTKSDNWYNNAFYNVLDQGISPSNSATANVTAWNALMALSVDNATIFFPPSISAYSFASTLAIPAGRHIRVMGGGNQKTIIQTTSATADIFTVGDWYNEFWLLKFTSSVTRTAGAAINSGNNVAMNVFDCDFAGMYNGIVYTGGASAGNLALVFNCHFTNTVNFSIQMDGQNANAIISKCTADCSPATNVHLEVNQCGSLLISDSDFIRATNNMRINPDSGIKGVFSIYCTNVFFDTAAGSSVKYQGSGTTNIQRSKFVNCWFSGSVNGVEFASTAATLPTAIDFVNCDIYSNSANGILATAVQDFSMSNCRVAGNATAGVNTVAATGSVTKFNIQNNTFGPTAGVGANGIGINIQAGTYGSYNITGNNVVGNTSNLNIVDNGTVATTDMKIIGDNLGHLINGIVASQGATPLSVPITTETVVLSARLPANAVSVGQVFTIKAIGVMSAANVPTWRVRVGANGTTADTACWTVTTAAGAANGRHGCDVLLTVRAIGASGSVNAEGLGQSGTTTTAITFAQPTLAAATTTAIASNAAWFITLTLSQTIGTSLIQQAVIAAL
jgi:hypothetical protein